jgi:transmembrane sensor
MSADREGPDDLSWVVVDRYLAGTCTPAEREHVERWVRSHPVEGADLARLRDVLRQATPVPDAPDLDRVMASIKARRGRRLESGEAAVPTPRRARAVAMGGGGKFGWLTRERLLDRPGARVVAAAAALLVVAGAATIWNIETLWRGPVAIREFSTIAGTRSTVTLRDGTRLTLGPATRVRVPADFGNRSRTVELDGEAVFAVVHDAKRPFVVHTQHTTVRDVGTTFVVRAYAPDGAARVAVAEGEVAVGGAALKANDAASIDTAGRITVRRGVDVSRDFGWSTGRLEFEDTPLRDVAKEIERTYGIDVTIADSAIARKLVTASFSDESVDEVLTTVTRVVGAQYTRNGRTVVIRRGVVPAGQRGGTPGDEVHLADERISR